MVHKEHGDELLKENGKGFTAQRITEPPKCDEKCVDWPRDTKDKKKRCNYCTPESPLLNQKRTKT